MDRKSRPEVVIKWELVTPTLAREYLACRDPEYQRTYRPALGTSYATEMKAGFWFPNGETNLIFDEKGRLLDGQHTLGGIIESGTSQWLLVARNVSERSRNGVYAIDTIDRGTSRTVGEQITLRHGYKSGNAIAATARIIATMICPAGTQTGRMSVPKTLAILKIYDQDVQAVVGILYLGSKMSIWRRGAICGPLAVARHVAQTEIDAFIHQIACGEGLVAGTPAHSLWRWRCGEGLKATSGILTNAVAMAAMKYYGNECMKTVNKLSRAGVEFWLAMQPRNVEYIRRMLQSDGAANKEVVQQIIVGSIHA